MIARLDPTDKVLIRVLTIKSLSNIPNKTSSMLACTVWGLSGTDPRGFFFEPYIRRRLAEQSQKETGLIAQDVWYDAPESRHIVSLPSDATPAEEKPTGGENIQQDPDYDGAGWGTESASVSYTQLIPVLVKSNQELHERIVDHDAQIAYLEAAVESRDQQIDELRSELSDIVSRLEAVESG